MGSANIRRFMTGRTFEHYEVEEELGRGGMGVVYRARDTKLGRQVALKVLPPDLTGDEERKDRFKREARLAARLTHPAIAQIYDVDEGPDGIFMAMELVEGRTVRSLIQARELDLLGAVEIAIQVAGGLQSAHEAGIVHRDIKPENLIVTPDGHAKILDFGLAKLLEAPKQGAQSPDGISNMETLAKTQAGFVLGTLRYMSPEQARGQAVDSRSDIFSLGIVLYEMVTGSLPFSGASPLDTLHAIAFEETRPITALRPNLPPSLQRVVSRCLRKRASDRYADAKELAADLKTVQREVESGISSKAPFAARLQESWRSLQERTIGEWLLPALIVVAIVVVVVALYFRSGGGIGPGVVSLVIGGLLVWRRFRNQRQRLARRFTAKVRKVTEVRIVALDGSRFVVVADQAQARTYVRINAALDAVNASMFFGEPFTLVVKEQLAPEDEKALLSTSGILYARETPRLAVSG